MEKGAWQRMMRSLRRRRKIYDREGDEEKSEKED